VGAAPIRTKIIHVDRLCINVQQSGAAGRTQLRRNEALGEHVAVRAEAGLREPEHIIALQAAVLKAFRGLNVRIKRMR
jgi:hypothetical protein